MEFPVLEGPRVRLRRVEADRKADVEAMYRCYCCQEVHRYTDGRSFLREEWPEIIREWEAERKQGGFIRWGIALKASGALIGGVYLYQKEERCCVGYMLHPSKWRQGYASEALSAVKEYAFAQGVAALYASADRQNAASIRLLERAGFQCIEKSGPEWTFRCGAV